MTRDDDAARLLRVLVDVMVAAVPLDPAVPLQSCHNLRPVGFGLGHGNAPMRKYWRIRIFQSILFRRDDFVGSLQRAGTGTTVPNPATGLVIVSTSPDAMRHSMPATIKAGR